MHITFRNSSLEKLVNNGDKLIRKFGDRVARAVKVRMGVLEAANCLELIPHTPPERRHELQGKRKGQFAVDTTKASGVRIIFKPNHDPVTMKEDGGVDLSQVSKIVIWEIGDYHD